ncbi:response regulator [Nocardioides sp. HDW12B]|uniref:sensor histidine kinase n=1 Tax=Nocardioides sp. HDW12B TaxID=2714939 RepID=UPI00140A04FB|nr:response regulator [Nocardioides sp. HDW12B]QIK67078.1 response regulator [Nocardioides sp. HDW12B]
MTVRAVIVDDTPDLRLLLRLTLERDGDITIVGEAEDGRQGIEVTGRLQPDLVMLDLAMPVMDGLEALPRIKAGCPEARVVVLSGFEAGAMQDRALRAGADAYVQKGASPKEILALVRSLVGREPEPTATVPSARSPRAPDREPPAVTAPVASRAAELTATGLLVLGADDDVRYANPAARALLGWDAATPLPGSLSDLSPPLSALVSRARSGDLAAGVEDRVLGGPVPIDVTVRGDGVEVVVGLAPSRSDEEVARLRRAIRTTAHEIRNPVTLLSGIAGVVADAGSSLSDHQQTHLLAAVGRQAAVLERVTDDLLAAAQAGRGTLRVDVRRLELAPLLREIVADVAGAQPVQVSVPAHVVVLADRTRVNQMVANLLTNAFKYADGPYLVQVTEVPSVRRPFVRVAVLDAGPGVEEDFRPRLFDEFARAESTREQGTGLGLYVVRALAEAQGGRADYDPRPGGGSEFSVHLPAAERSGGSVPGGEAPANRAVPHPAQTGRPLSL